MSGEVSAEEEDSRKYSENCKCDNLHNNTGDCDVASKAHLTQIALGTSGQSSTGSLQTERDAVADDKEPDVVFRPEIAVLRSERFEDMLQSELNSHGEMIRQHICILKPILEKGLWCSMRRPT